MTQARTQILPNAITTYDLIKSFAVIIMIIDHVGYYFFPDDLWWRAIGRIGFPVWFFLVGYSKGRGIPKKLWIGAFLLLPFNFIAGMHIFPLNALFTIIFIRLSIDHLLEGRVRNNAAFWALNLLLFLLVLPSYFVTEYGTQALITAIFGYIIRRKDEIGDKDFIRMYTGFALLTFIFIQQITFQFSTEQFIFMTLGTALVRISLVYFQSRTFPKLTTTLPAPLTSSIQFMGRRTLEIYVVHLIIFKLAALASGQPDYQLFYFHWI